MSQVLALASNQSSKSNSSDGAIPPTFQVLVNTLLMPKTNKRSKM
jgi:hypothetical protein